MYRNTGQRGGKRGASPGTSARRSACILKERAADEIIGRQKEMDLLESRELHKMDCLIEKHFEELLKTDPDYLELAQAALGAKQHSAKGKSKEAGGVGGGEVVGR